MSPRPWTGSPLPGKAGDIPGDPRSYCSLLSLGKKQHGRSGLGSLATCAIYLWALHVPLALWKGQPPNLWPSVQHENMVSLFKEQTKSFLLSPTVSLDPSLFCMCSIHFLGHGNLCGVTADAHRHSSPHLKRGVQVTHARPPHAGTHAQVLPAGQRSKAGLQASALAPLWLC